LTKKINRKVQAYKERPSVTLPAVVQGKVKAHEGMKNLHKGTEGCTKAHEGRQGKAPKWICAFVVKFFSSL
jgi:hypothetical protein